MKLLQEEFAPCATLRGRYAASVVRRVESLPLASLALTGCFARDFVRGWIVESERQVDGLFESVLNESFGG
jgi:hypothetical protein